MTKVRAHPQATKYSSLDVVPDVTKDSLFEGFPDVHIYEIRPYDSS